MFSSAFCTTKALNWVGSIQTRPRSKDADDIYRFECRPRLPRGQMEHHVRLDVVDSVVGLDGDGRVKCACP